ncbi:MAG TPA: serine/threonine-protein kinase [Gemmatimonadaceae bacterium]|nr:serine/threonine-protein kinase [Gemmatimonadaceae bacterium]
MAPVTVDRDTTTDSLTLDYRPPVKAPAVNPLGPLAPLTSLREDWLRGDTEPDTDIQFRMHPVTLRFEDRDLEREFEEEYFARTLVQVRLALVVGVMLYSVYGIVDFWLAPSQRTQIWIIRYLIVAPVALAVLWFSYRPNFRRFRDLSLFVVIMVAQLGIVGMTSLTPQPMSSLYDVGLFMVIMYAFTLVRLTVVWGIAVALFTLAIYPTAALLVHSTPTAVVGANLGFLLGMAVLGFVANYSMGRYARGHFLQRRLISLRTEELERKNSELIIKNQLLAESRAANVRTARRTEQIFSALSEALPGHILDEKYRIGAKIGSGGFGTVYRGEHILLHHPVAIKVFRPAVGREGVESLERFRLEGISACRVNHPNAVSVLDFDVSSGSLAYLVMELLEGHSLSQELRRVGRLPQLRAAEIACCVCDALAQAHAAGIVHRDIKPSNVFLHATNDGEHQVKVIDFGIAKLTDESELPAAKTMTMSGVFLGTPAYMAPERIFNQPYDGRADVYAVGVMVYEMVTGRLPFDSGTDGHISLMRMHIMQKARPLSSLAPDVYPKLDIAVTSAMRKEPEERPTAQQLSAMLRDAILDAKVGRREARGERR